MEILPGQLNDMGQREFEIVLCKCDMLDLLMNYAVLQLTSEFSCQVEGDAEVYWAGEISAADHFPMARVKLHAIQIDTGPPN